MARGDMRVENRTYGGNAEILNRPPFEGVPMTIDFAGVTTAEPTTGEKVVKAGTPIDKVGKSVTATPWTGAVGILLEDVYEHRPQGTILQKAYINVTRAQAHNGLTYDGALAQLFRRIQFEEPIILPTAPTSI